MEVAYTFVDEDNISDDMKCMASCYQPFANPYICISCGNSCCLSCINSSGKCPVCRTPYSKSTNSAPLFVLNRSLATIVDKLQVVCTKCEKQMRRDQYDNHDCFVHCAKCQLCLLSSNLPAHQQLCPKEIIGCLHCEIKTEREIMPSHELACPNFPIICSKCQNIFLRKKRADHQDSCSHAELICIHKDCPQSLYRFEFKNHISLCPFRTVKCVDRCTVILPVSEMKEHVKSCIYYECHQLRLSNLTLTNQLEIQNDVILELRQEIMGSKNQTTPDTNQTHLPPKPFQPKELPSNDINSPRAPSTPQKSTSPSKQKQNPSPNSSSSSNNVLLISNIHFKATREEMKDLCKQFGRVLALQMRFQEKEKILSCLVAFMTHRDAEIAFSKLNNKPFKDRQLRIKWSNQPNFYDDM